MSEHRHGNPEVEQNQPGVLCIKCNHLNVLETATCKRCGAALYRDCPRCGHSNPLVFANCRKCHKRFPRGILGNRSRKLRKAQSLLKRALITAGQVALVLVALAVLAGLAYVVVDYFRVTPE
jgi:ribosomal protein L40E